MSETATTNYAFKKERLGHPPRDTALGSNLDAIDTTLKTLSDTIGDFGPLASAKIVVGNSGGAAAAVDMSGDTTVDNLGEVTIGAGKVEIANQYGRKYCFIRKRNNGNIKEQWRNFNDRWSNYHWIGSR
jgi:hypothetical protein